MDISILSTCPILMVYLLLSTNAGHVCVSVCVWVCVGESPICPRLQPGRVGVCVVPPPRTMPTELPLL